MRNRDKNGCGSDGCKTFAVNVVKHTTKTNGAQKVTKAAHPKWERFKLNAQGVIGPQDFAKLIGEEYSKLSTNPDLSPADLEGVRSSMVGVINDAFGYAAADSQGSDDLADNTDESDDTLEQLLNSGDRDEEAVQMAKDGE